MKIGYKSMDIAKISESQSIGYMNRVLECELWIFYRVPRAGARQRTPIGSHL